MILLKTIYNYLYLNIPKPHKFSTLNLHSSLAEVTEISSKINELLPQITDFINQFNTIINTNSISVITDTAGNMEIEGPANMSDADLNKIGKRIGIIDRLITTRGEQISDLIHKGLSLEANLKKEDVNYTSQLVEKINEFKKLSSSYKH
jgi:hypothetical protein